ncbi:caspase b-like [Sander vitreus]
MAGAPPAANLYYVLRDILRDLNDNDFNAFKWHLRIMTDIPRSDLEPADRLRTVDLMIQYHRQDAVNMTMDSLRQIPRNDLVERLPAQ